MGLLGLNIGDGPISAAIPPGGNEPGSERIIIHYLHVSLSLYEKRTAC
jgi:hypothetical protein